MTPAERKELERLVAAELRDELELRREHWREYEERRITHIIGWIAIGCYSIIALATIWSWVKGAFAWP